MRTAVLGGRQPSTHTRSLRTLKHLLEIQGQVCGDNTDVKQVLHMLKLALLEVAEDVQYLQETKRQSESAPVAIEV